MKQNSSVWRCETCETEEMSVAEIAIHVTDVHKIDVCTQKFVRTLLMHLDGRDYYGSTYRMTAGELSLVNCVRTARS